MRENENQKNSVFWQFLVTAMFDLFQYIPVLHRMLESTEINNKRGHWYVIR